MRPPSEGREPQQTRARRVERADLVRDVMNRKRQDEPSEDYTEHAEPIQPAEVIPPTPMPPRTR